MGFYLFHLYIHLFGVFREVFEYSLSLSTVHIARSAIMSNKSLSNASELYSHTAHPRQQNLMQFGLFQDLNHNNCLTMTRAIKIHRFHQMIPHFFHFVNNDDECKS